MEKYDLFGFPARNENEELTVGIDFIKIPWALCRLKRERTSSSIERLNFLRMFYE